MCQFANLDNIKKYWVDGSNLMHWNRAIFYNDPDISGITGTGNSGIVYSKKIWEDIGGHFLENAGYDMSFTTKILSIGGVIYASPPDNEVSWIYRWGGGDYHMSGCGTDTPDRPNVLQRHAAHIENLRFQGKIPVGKVELKPYWKFDYSDKLRKFVENNKK